MKPRPEWVEMFRRRNVTLVFDSDPAGEFGLARWIKALKGVANELRIAKLPEGEDVVRMQRYQGPELLSEGAVCSAPAYHGTVRDVFADYRRSLAVHA